MRDTSIAAYKTKRDFKVTAEPAPGPAQASSQPMFVVQKHHARRAGLHWDFRLEHGGVLISWAVPKGPSLDPADRRMAVHVEDHPIAYAEFRGTIPEGQYGAGKVETWDRGTWTPEGDADEGMRKGHLRFELDGQRLKGRFTLARLSQRDPRKPEGWYLIKGKDQYASAGLDAAAMEQAGHPEPQGAKRASLPERQAPQLCTALDEPPDGDEWVSEIKFDGYRLLASVQDGKVRLLTRNGHDWADRLPAVARAIGQLPVQVAMLDGELVSLDDAGVSSFPALQAALAAGRDDRLMFYAFDLLHLDGWDLRPCSLLERKRVLRGLNAWKGMLRYSDHHAGDAHALKVNACRMHLEGIVCKKADAPYRGGRGHAWVKVKCGAREELVVLGWTPPAGSRVGIGALHVGYFDPEGTLHYAGGVGTGFDDNALAALRKRLDPMKAPPPAGMQVAGDPIDRLVTWVRPELVIEVKFTDWSGAGRVRHAVYLGLREDKAAADVVRDVADPVAERSAFRGGTVKAGKGWHGAVPPLPRQGAKPPARAAAARITVAQAPRKASVEVAGVKLTHADRALWPGVTKQDLADYWQAVADVALPGIALRPLSILRCPDGIDGREKFFQKNGHGIMPEAIRDGTASGQPYLAIDGIEGLIAMAQMSAIELHAWGALEDQPTKPDRLVFDLDPGEGVAWPAVVKAAQDVRRRLEKAGLISFCRTTGGKGLHVVVPLKPAADWDAVKPFCHHFAETIAREEPDRFLAHVKIADRKGRILIDWLRNGLGATAVASFSPRARPGATVATPVSWAEVTAKLDPSAFTVRTVPARLAKLKKDPWADFTASGQRLPVIGADKPAKAKAAPDPKDPAPARGRSTIVIASKPKPWR